MCVGREGEHVSTIPYDGRSSTFEKHNSDSIMHVGVTMATLHSRCGHYIFVLWLLSSFFIPHLISVVADWMSTILLHMVWP